MCFNCKLSFLDLLNGLFHWYGFLIESDSVEKLGYGYDGEKNFMCGCLNSP